MTTELAGTEFRGTASDCVAFYERMADTGQMNASTAMARRSSVIRVLSGEDGWEDLDLWRLEIEEQLRRFREREHDALRPHSISTYEGRFRSAVQDYLVFLRDPDQFKPPRRRRVVRRAAEGGSTAAVPVASEGRGRTQAREPASVDAGEPLPGRLVVYPFPLRRGLVAYLHLPLDLEPEEADRMSRFLQSMAIDRDREGEGRHDG